MDAYKGLEDGRLGENFSLIKMKSPSASGSEVSRMKNADNASSSQISRRPSLDAGIKALPQWLCSTFSTLPAKHPLRLLLPERPSNTQYTSMTLSPALIARPNSQTQPETDPIFAFSLYQPTGNIQGDESANQVDENEAAHHMLLSTNIARTPPFRGSLFGVQKYLLPHQLPPSPDHVLSPPGILPFSTPGPNSVVSQPCVSASMFRSTTGDSQMDARGPSLPPGFDELDFVPFLTPGPVSTLSSASDTVSHGLHSAYDSDPQDCLVDNVSLAQSPHISPFLLHGPSASHTAQPVSPNGSPLCLPVDLCLPPYNAPSDPAPAYSSEDIPEYSYYEDPLTDDHDSSSRPLFDQPSCVASNLPNTSTYSGSEYRTDGPIYFDSPTEDPSDSDPLEPGYDIDYGAIDFKWEPFNRKGISESQRTPSIKPHHDPYSIYQGSQDPGLDYADITQHRGCSNVASLTPERVPSPSPFRFSPNQFMSRGIVAPPPAHEPSPQVDPSDTPEPQLLAPAFAPAPGIFISPLRGEPAASLSPLPVCLIALEPYHRTLH
ncbi:hypothetical protein FPV67DRAFT_1668051 [Lyophyllum atratum]|nr:hypothetical protein FPV67DRAFT_1668051 [Lyophyllum atratum]